MLSFKLFTGKLGLEGVEFQVLFLHWGPVLQVLSFKLFTGKLGLEGVEFQVLFLHWGLGVGSVEFQSVHWQPWAGRC